MGSTARSPRVRARVTPHRGPGESLVPLYTRESVSLSPPREQESTPAFAATPAAAAAAAAAADVPAAPVPDALDEIAHVNAWLRLAEELLTCGGGTAARARADLTALVAESKKVDSRLLRCGITMPFLATS